MDSFTKITLAVLVLFCLFFAIGSTRISVIDVSALDNTTLNIVVVSGYNDIIPFSYSNKIERGYINEVL